VSKTECLAVAETKDDNRMTPIIQYLEDGTCKPEEEKTMKQQCARYTMINKDLYRRGYAEMHHQRASRVCPDRDTASGMWKSFGGTDDDF